MSIGLNKNVNINGQTYHIQIEDKELKKTFEVRVYVQGRIIFQKHHSYQEALEKSENKEAVQNIVQEELKKLFFITKTGIERGKIKI